MVKRASAVFLLSLLATCGFAKDKTKNILPAYVLQAKTVAVVIDPSAGISIDDPRANEMAQKDVEAAFLKWGRFDPVSDPKTADLIVMVRKGNSHLMDDTMPDLGKTAESIRATVGVPSGLHEALNRIFRETLASVRAGNLPRRISGTRRTYSPFSKAAKIPSTQPRCGRMRAGMALTLRLSSQ